MLNFIINCASKLPLSALYRLSNFLAWLAGDVIRYRRRVIEKNLAECFPQKNATELKIICKNYYRWLGDYIVETVKLKSIRDDEMFERMQFCGMEIVEQTLREKRDIVLLLGHYGNWEWVSSIPAHLKIKDCEFGQIYHPLENKQFDSLMLTLRSRFGAESIKMRDTLRSLRQWRREGKNNITGFIADQAPGMEGIHLFLPFLNHDTAVYTGAERIARMFNSAIFYLDIQRPERGKYRAEFVKICDNCNDMEQFEPTKIFFEMLEQSIRRDPSMWLWSHRRWKRSREMFMEYFGREEAQKLLSHL